MVRPILLLTTAFIASGFSESAAADKPKRPNVLVIFADDQSYKTLSCYPEKLPGVKTPNIDKLAATGVRFHGAFLGAWCMPSRASMLTGHWPHGVESMRMEGKYPASAYDPQQCPFWPKTWRKQGYTTAHIGKWHTGIDAGTGRDWDWQIVWNRPLHPDNAGHYYDQQILSFNGAERMTEGYSTDNYSQWASEFIKGEHRDASKPWYLWLCYGAIHGPTTPAERHKGMHKDDEVRVPADIFPPREGKPDYLNKTQAWKRGPNGEIFAGKSGESFGDESGKKNATYQSYIHQVNECVEALDEGVGKVMAALKESGQLENTLVIYTADQGFSMGEHGFRTKLAPYDANYRSPLIVSMPGTLPQGKSAPHCVTSPDLVATFHAFAGIQPSWAMHGRDLTPLLKNPDMKWPHPVFYEFTGETYGRSVAKIVNETPEKATYHDVPWYVVARDDRWKLIHYLETGVGEELYDLQNDPEELTNVASKAEHKEVIARLRKQLNAELERTGAGFSIKQ
ncbi:MAG: sulfatase-like hydrolase/transferase [Chthoniobacteraceae bacterium]